MSQEKSAIDRLVAKIIIRGTLVARTALHIGGSKDGIDIGGVDLNVIKNYKGEPFIPGSSFKGKLRSMLARVEGTRKVSPRDKDDKTHTDKQIKYLSRVFGQPADETYEDGGTDASSTNGDFLVTRLIVRDAPMQTQGSPSQDDYPDMDFRYTDVKFENSIDRIRGVADNPRQLERVPAGARFSFELVINEFLSDARTYTPNHDNPEGEQVTAAAEISGIAFYLNAIGLAMNLLQDDYIGGHGSRGYGRIGYTETEVVRKSIAEGYQAEASESDFITDFKQVLRAIELTDQELAALVPQNA